MNRDNTARWKAAIQSREQLLGRESLRRMAEIYAEEAEGLLNSVISALAESDFERARRGAHNLSSNAGSLDFNELMSQLHRLEKLCVDADRQGAMMALGDIVPAMQRSVAQLMQHFEL